MRFSGTFVDLINLALSLTVSATEAVYCMNGVVSSQQSHYLMQTDYGVIGITVDKRTR